VTAQLIGIVANEPSGDQLGAGLIAALRRLRPELRFVGVAGPRMLAQGCETLLPMERLSVMGLVEVLKVLPSLVRARRELVVELRRRAPAVVVGVDAPDFNLGLERRLRAAGVPTVHLVSPTVWAWRPGRVKAIRRSLDLMLSIFPFEVEFLRRHGVPVEYVGHPLADEIPLQVDRAVARHGLGLAATSSGAAADSDDGASGPVIALLPGSRSSEVDALAAPMLETAAWIQARCPSARFIAPMVSQRLYRRFDAMRMALVPDLPLQLFDGRSREVIAAADCVVTASGTATLETLLLKRPMVVAYRLHWLTYALVTRLRLIKVRYAAMANLLVGRELAPEFLQDRCRADLMGPAVLSLLDDPLRQAEIEAAYGEVHLRLKQNAAARAAEAILALVDRRVAQTDG
jgi:lipid-A-disaccharide synthase